MLCLLHGGEEVHHLHDPVLQQLAVTKKVKEDCLM